MKENTHTDCNQTYLSPIYARPRGYKKFHVQLISVKMPTVVGILAFMSRKHLKFHAQLS